MRSTTFIACVVSGVICFYCSTAYLQYMMAGSSDWTFRDVFEALCPLFSSKDKYRKSVTRATAKLTTLLEGDFRQANALIQCFNENLPGKTFSGIALNRGLTVAENCAALADCLFQMFAHMEDKREKLQNTMDPDLYEELMSDKTQFANKIKAARRASKEAISSVGSVTGMVAISIISEGDSIRALRNSLIAVSQSVIATMTIASLSDDTDGVIAKLKAAAGSHPLDGAIADLEVNVESLDEASYPFSRSVDRVIVRIDG